MPFYTVVRLMIVCLIGMGAIVLDRAHIHQNSMEAAGAIVLEGFNVPEGMLVASVPAKVKRALTEEEKAIHSLISGQLY